MRRRLYWQSQRNVLHWSTPGDEMTRCGRPYAKMTRVRKRNADASRCRECFR